jgi:hypothetical protein
MSFEKLYRTRMASGMPAPKAAFDAAREEGSSMDKVLTAAVLKFDPDQARDESGRWTSGGGGGGGGKGPGGVTELEHRLIDRHFDDPIYSQQRAPAGKANGVTAIIHRMRGGDRKVYYAPTSAIRDSRARDGVEAAERRLREVPETEAATRWEAESDLMRVKQLALKTQFGKG